MASKKKKKSEWPPSGWKVETKVCLNGRPYKCYINTKTGEKVYSKLAVLRCIKKGKSGNEESQSHGKKQHPKTKPENKEMHLVKANDSLNLPPGWTLEWKVRQSGARKGTKYKCITDPSTGSKFYSMPEVYRYLRSRNGSAGSSKQAKGETLSNSENNPTPPSNTEKTNKGGKRKHLIDEGIPTQSILNNEVQSKRLTRSSSKVQSVSTGLELTVHETVPAKPNEEISAVGGQSKRITRSSSKVRSAPTCEPSLELIPFLPEQAMTANETVSSAGAQSKRRTRSSAKAHSASSCEPGIEKILSLPVCVKPNGKVSSVEDQSKRRTRLSAKVRSASTCEPGIEKVPSLPGPAKTPLKTVPVKPNGEVSAVEGQRKRSTRSFSKVESSPTKILLLPEPAKTAQETVPAKTDDVFPVGAQSKKRTRSTKVAREIVPAKHDGEVPSIGGPSMRGTRSTSKVQSTYKCEPSLELITPLLPEPVKGAQKTVPAKIDGEVSCVGAQSKRRRRSSARVRPTSMSEPNLERTRLLPEPDKGALEMVPVKTDGAVFVVEAISDVRQKVHAVDGVQTNAVSRETERSTFRKRKSDNKLQRSSVRKTRTNKRTVKERKMTNLSSCSSERLAEVEAAVPLHSIPTEPAHFSTKNSGKTNAISDLDLVPNESQQRAQALDDYRQNVVTSQQETYWSFDVSAPTVQVDSVEKIDYLSQEYIEAIFLQEDEGPPGFSHYPRTKVTQSTIDQLFEDSVYNTANDMIEKSPQEHNIPKEHRISEDRTEIDKSSRNCPVLEGPTTLGRNNGQPGSQLCFSSPLWSDPCLEFAFKTLTGALPLDDNVAIQDYMEHQIRTCDPVNNNNNKPSPDIGMPRFCHNVEAKLAPQFQQDNAGFIKSNGKPSR